MKSRLLTRFTSWFFNTSPEWVAPEQEQIDSAGMPLQEEQQVPSSVHDQGHQGDAAATDASPDRR